MYKPTPVQVTCNVGATSNKFTSIVAVGPHHAILQSENGDLYGIGSNQDFQLPMSEEVAAGYDPEIAHKLCIKGSSENSLITAGWGFSAQLTKE